MTRAYRNHSTLNDLIGRNFGASRMPLAITVSAAPDTRERRANPRQAPGTEAFGELCPPPLSVTVNVSSNAAIQPRLGEVVTCPNCRGNAVARGPKASCPRCGNVWNAVRPQRRVEG